MREAHDVRVLITGGLVLDQSILSLVEGFRRAGCQTTYLRGQEVIENKKVARPGLEDLVREASAEADLLIWWQPKDGPDPHYAEGLRGLRPQLVTAGMSVDDPHVLDIATPESEARLTAWKFGLTCCPGSRDWYRQRNVTPITAWTPCDRDRHGRAAPDLREACDIGFAATNMYGPERFPHVLANRGEMVKAVADLGTVRLYGQWDEHEYHWGGKWGVGEKLKPLWQGPRSNAQMPGVYAAARITLNSTVRPDGWQYVNRRVIEAMACGSFVLSDRIAGIEELLEEDLEIALWSTIEELRDKAAWWLKHERTRQAAAEAGRRKALALFDNETLARRILLETGLVTPPKPPRNGAPPPPAVVDADAEGAD